MKLMDPAIIGVTTVKISFNSPHTPRGGKAVMSSWLFGGDPEAVTDLASAQAAIENLVHVRANASLLAPHSPITLHTNIRVLLERFQSGVADQIDITIIPLP